MNFIKEACVESFESAVAAEKNGADRIEICSNLELDGLTPSREIVRKLIKTLNIPIKVMIRPKAGDFCYNKQEIKEMLDDIAYFRSLGVYGVVFVCVCFLRFLCFCVCFVFVCVCLCVLSVCVCA